MIRWFTVLGALNALALSLFAQAGMPVVSQALPDLILTTDGGTRTIDLRSHFAAQDVTGQIVQFTGPLGTFNVEMLASAAPNTVANFLAYVNDAAYNNTIVHRSSKLSGTGNQVIQGGGYTHSLPVGNVVSRTAIALEYNLPNTRGTIAMARGSALNSATNQWFINVDDNSTVLGQSNNGGYAVFGRVLGSGLTVVDAIATVPVFAFEAPFGEIPLRNYTTYPNGVQITNFVNFTTVSVVPVYPTAGAASSVLGFVSGSTNSHPSVVNAQISGSNLILAAQPNASGVARITITATDTNGNTARSSFNVGVSPAGVVVVPPASAPVLGGSVTLGSLYGGTATGYQWMKNGVAIPGATAASHVIGNLTAADAGLYTVQVAHSGGTLASDPVAIAPTITTKVEGAAYEFSANIRHPNGNYYDQLLLTGTAATFTADAGQVTRLSYIDLNDDIVQVEFSGRGSLTIVLNGATGPAAPAAYNQPAVSYMKGHASLYISGAAADTFVSAFTVGRLTAYDPTGAYDITKPISDTNRPANNGNGIFKAGTAYDGVADIALLAIASPTNEFGAILSANANYWHDSGITGIYAPGVTFTSAGRVFLHDLNARGSASPVLRLGNASDARITGGNLKQDNNASVVVSGLTQLRMAAGTDSHGNSLTAQANQGRLVNTSGTDVTTSLIIGP